jgi:hypothetical protein
LGPENALGEMGSPPTRRKDTASGSKTKSSPSGSSRTETQNSSRAGGSGEYQNGTIGIGPDRRQRRAWCGDAGRRPTAAIAPIPIAQVACFRVRFDIAPPSPAQPFTVTVFGILRAGQAWPAVAVDFTKGEVWEGGTLP